MKTWLGLALLAGLAACKQAGVPDGPAPLMLRNPTAQIGSQVDVVAADLAGDWYVRQGVTDTWPATVGGMTLGAEGAALTVLFSGGVCDPAGICFDTVEALAYAPVAPGRWQATEPGKVAQVGFPAEFWVYWMDFDDRTIAVGDPNSGFVAILDRAPNGGGDRIQAARDILEWYGYDLTRIQEVRR